MERKVVLCFLMFGVVLLELGSINYGIAADWPQWRGINRNGISGETGLLKKWPTDGPKLVWSTEDIGKGYSSAVIANGTIYITGMDDNKKEFLSTFDLNGKLKWRTSYGNAWTKSFPETRTSPTVDDKYLYVISGLREVVCLDNQSGKVVWLVDIQKQFDGHLGRWGCAESPLIIDNMVIVTPAGAKTNMVALDKMTGKTIWQTRSLNDESAFASPILITHNGNRYIISVTAQYIFSVNPENGDIVWTYDYKKEYANIRGVTINSNSPAL